MNKKESPALACQAPLLVRAVSGATEWSAALASPPPSTNFPTGSTSLSLDGPSAFSIVPPATTTTSLSSTNILQTLYPDLMCHLQTALLERYPNVLRSPPMTSTFKPIPNNDKIDRVSFRVKDPMEWVAGDCIHWMMDVGKRNNVDIEDIQMTKFSHLNGKRLLEFTERDFLERDPIYGSLLFRELQKFGEDNLIDDFMKKYPTEEEPMLAAPSTSFDLPKPMPTLPTTTLHPTPVEHASHLRTTLPTQLTTQLTSSLHSPLSLSDQLQTHSLPLNHQNLIQGLALNAAVQQSLTQQSLTQQSLSHDLQTAQVQLQNAQLQQNLQQSLQQSLASTLAAGLNTGLSPMNIPLMQNGLSPSSPLLSTTIQPKLSPLPSSTTMPSSSMTSACEANRYNPGSVSSDYDCEDRLHGVDGKIKKNRDGRPRKRSQHTKGNKLWEFIRDALKDPDTSPSVVRWEDPAEGVFRIVESEKLARLWGARKNNTKMTYEKLSRAMRTYYEKQILVPVPKTGLYPKKLVYKFGPGAHGWGEKLVKEELH